MTIDEIINYVRQTPGNTNPNVLKTLLQDVSSGGGSSDFSIANVTIENNTNYELGFTLPLINEEENLFELTGGAVVENGSMTVKLPLYKNKILIGVSSAFYFEDPRPVLTSVSGSGSVNDSNGEITIYGDGTIEVTTFDLPGVG